MSTTAVQHTRVSQPLAISFVLSLLVHMVVGLALFAAWNAQLAAAPTLDRTQMPELQKPDPVRAGIIKSNAVTINWLGFETPTPHQAIQSSTDQAALAPLPAGQVVQQKPTTASIRKPASPVPVPESTSAPTPSSTLAQADLAAAKASILAARAKLAKIFATTLATAKARLQKPVQPTKNTAKKPTKIPSKTLAKQPPTATTDARPVANPSPASKPTPPTKLGTDTPGEKSDKESAATSKQKPIDWRPGHPAAAQGLDITTVSPHWSYTTRLSALPRNPLVRIEFARDGHVKKVTFLPKQSTGYPDVDGPLLDAIYRWKGKGKALDDLPKEPDAEVSLTFRIILNASRGKIQKPKTNSK